MTTRAHNPTTTDRGLDAGTVTYAVRNLNTPPPTPRGSTSSQRSDMPKETQQPQRPTAEQLVVVHHEADRFYELRVDGEFGGLLVYGKSDNRLVLTHTFIAEGFRGRGLSKFMIRGALDDIRIHGRTLTNYCPVIDGFIERHPEYISLIDEHNPGNWSRRDHQSRSAGTPTTLRP